MLNSTLKKKRRVRKKGIVREMSPSIYLRLIISSEKEMVGKEGFEWVMFIFTPEWELGKPQTL
jgi:hypothetical protein